MWLTLITLFVLSSAGAAILLRRAGGGSFPWIQFYTKGKESGFNFRELNLLRKVAVENHLQNPTSLFWSVKQLDRSIRGVITRYRMEGRETEQASLEMTAKLFNFRKKVEFDLPKWKLGLRSTRKLPNRQRIKISLQGVGTFDSQIVENHRRYMAIAYPEGRTLPPDFTWKGNKINVFFRRIDDAGYAFEARVLEDFKDQDYPILYIGHSDSLVRSQKRRSLRVEARRPCRVFPLASADSASEAIETRPGLRARLVDISEDGAAILVGGRAKVGLVIKAQFSLTDQTLVMNGVVKGVTFNQKKNQSILHVQALGVSAPTKNKILSFVYNVFGDRAETGRAGTSA